jgi:hypothetical protein
MPALNFQKQFADKVQQGEKTRTIRAAGKRAAPSVGQSLKLYTGMRTKVCRLLKEVTCTNVSTVLFWSKSTVIVNKIPLYNEAVDQFAQLDGFKDYAEMYKFFDELYQVGNDYTKQFNLIEW